MEKFKRNVERDQENYSELRDTGWNVFVIWECEVRRDPVAAVSNVVNFLSNSDTMSDVHQLF